jgi:hypothetical protein
MAGLEQSASRREDLAWGRARPPLRAWVPIAGWLAMAVMLTVVLAVVVRGPGPLDDPDPADQRPGFLVSPRAATRIRPPYCRASRSACARSSSSSIAGRHRANSSRPCSPSFQVA